MDFVKEYIKLYEKYYNLKILEQREFKKIMELEKELEQYRNPEQHKNNIFFVDEYGLGHYMEVK